MKNQSSEELLSEIYEYAFVNIKEASVRLQEWTKCSNLVVVKMLHEVVDFYINQEDKN